jgi:hypothetical protein
VVSFNCIDGDGGGDGDDDDDDDDDGDGDGDGDGDDGGDGVRSKVHPGAKSATLTPASTATATVGDNGFMKSVTIKY